MIVRKFTRDEWQQAFALAFMLHPSADVAFHVLIDASWIATLLEQTEARRQRSVAHYKSPIPREALLQFAVFCASLRWERDQESPLPKMEPRYQPTRDDLVVRYLKHLVCNNLLKARFRYLAIALGCLLYDYKPKQITDFLGLYDEPKIRHIKSRIKKQLMKRFVYADVFTPKRNALRTKPASDHDRQLLRDALKLLTPWNTAHITVKPGELRLTKMFAENSKLTNWDRKHLLLDPVCGGLEQLINEHNQLFREGLRLADPKLKLFVPDFDDTPTPPVDRFKAPRLTDGEITLLNERRKRIGPRTYDVNDLLSDLYECGVDESLIEVLDDSASSTTENPPLRVLSHGSYAKGTMIRKQFVEEEDAMGTMIVVVGHGGTGANVLSALSRLLLARPRPRFISLIDPDLPGCVLPRTGIRQFAQERFYPDRSISCRGNTGDISRYHIDVRITNESLGVLIWLPVGIVCSGADWNSFVPNDCPTVWDFIKRSISDDLMRHGTIRYPFTNVWERRHYLIQGVPMVQDFFGWSWFDCPTVWDFMERPISDDLIRHGTIRYPFTNVWDRIPYFIPGVPMVQDVFRWSWCGDGNHEPSVGVPSWIRLFCDDRERSNAYEVFYAGHGGTVSRHAESLPSPVYLKPNETRGYGPSLNFEDNPFETQSPFRLTPPTDGYLAVIAQHSVEDALRKDLKPYVLKEELLVSDWYDDAGTRRLQDGFLPNSFRSRNATRVKKKTDARHSEAGPWGESSFPIWGIQRSANRASPEASTDAR